MTPHIVCPPRLEVMLWKLELACSEAQTRVRTRWACRVLVQSQRAPPT